MNLIALVLRALFKPPRKTRPPRTVDRRHPTAQPRDTKIGRLPPLPASGVISGKCHVIDGDTIVIRRTKIRLAGIDAPELDQPYGQKSKWAMVTICRGRTVTARLTGERSYDRLVGTCTLEDGRDIGAELVKAGLALDWPVFSGGRYRHLEPPGARRRLRAARVPAGGAR